MESRYILYECFMNVSQQDSFGVECYKLDKPWMRNLLRHQAPYSKIVAVPRNEDPETWIRGFFQPGVKLV